MIPPFAAPVARAVRLAAGLALFAGALRAEVTRFELLRRADVGTSGLEKIVGRLHFAVDPAAAGNRVIADLALAPRDAAGRVAWSADFYALRPKPGSGAPDNGAALVEVSNRGGRGLISSFNRGGSRDPETDADLGDRFLQRQGFTLVWVGWEFDVPPAAGAMRVDLPVATDAGRPLSAVLHARLVADSRVKELTPPETIAYPPSPDDPALALARLGPGGAATPLPRDRWRLRGGTVVLDAGFEPGVPYELAFTAARPPVAGLGFATLRDTAAWLKHAPAAAVSARLAYAFGSSQSGRFLRDFLYHGFNTDERDRPVFDAVLAHIAGAARIDLNRRWSVPRTLGLFAATAYPFSDSAQPDPLGGPAEGLLENPRVRHVPKIFYTNTAVEYWGGGRSAALVHTDPAGTRDAGLPAHVRVYAFAGTQHGPARFPPGAPTTTAQPVNPADYWWPMRALLPALHRWAAAGTAPPPSTYPTFRDGTLVPAAAVAFPVLPGVTSPRALTARARVANPLLPGGASPGAPLPLVVPQTDADGNETGGLRLPEIAVPLATHTGWNHRSVAAGAPGELVPLLGGWIPFAATAAERTARGDPRPSIAERYPSRADFLARYRAATEALVRRGYLLAEDTDRIVAQGAARWDHLVPGSGGK